MGLPIYLESLCRFSLWNVGYLIWGWNLLGKFLSIWNLSSHISEGQQPLGLPSSRHHLTEQAPELLAMVVLG